ncbi:hypothetical protein [Priestia megaterium]|uniref:hypothetical protein n=1 Tax=Priestia megaterium TaxID=1404 RepID=UPI002040D791|nr:hypothetical protein [Priestia megaterium]MCM3098803.1 hypothetical protein [Priestia megaterium]
MIGGEGEDSCRKEPAGRKRREGSAAACGNRSLARESTAVLKVIHTNSFIPFVRL